MFTNTINTSRPWASFCLATYRRPELLEKTLKSIQAQTMPDFEVIVSDNDPDGSSRIVVESLQDSRFRYFCNSENLGMVKNFNKALERAEGEFVVMITDDDPPYADMLETLRSLSELYPGYGAYYGACNVRMVDDQLAKLYNVKPGLNSCLANIPAKTIRKFSAENFPIAYFSNQIFPYVLWSTGVVRREIALEIGGMPDYGSPYLTDFGYICLAGSHSGCVTINSLLGHQTVHNKNFGRQEYEELYLALKGCYEYITQRMSFRSDWSQVRPLFENFLANWIVNHSLFLIKYFKLYKINYTDKLNKVLNQIFQLNYMKRFKWKYIQKKYRLDFIQKIFYYANRVKIRLKTAWNIETRT